MNLFLASGLRYLWKMVSLLQFMVYMRNWQVDIPSETDAFLKQLKALALLEFLPTDKIDNELIDLFGISTKEEVCVDGECRESIFD